MLFLYSLILSSLNYSNCTTAARLEAPAQRLVTLDINSTEIALALGLNDSIVGVAGVDKAQVPKLPYISSFYPSLQQLEKVKPDLVIGGWKNGFSRGTPVEPQSLLQKGINSYVLAETCVHAEGHSTAPISFAQTLFKDLEAIGLLSGQEPRAASLVSQMQRRLSDLEADVQAHGRAEKVRVLVYDGGYSQALTIGGEALLSEAIRVAGGRNIIADRPGTWQILSWDEVIQADPELILVVDYGSGDAFYKIQDIRDNPSLQSVSAVRDQHYFTIPYAAAITGIRSVGIAELLADHLICVFNPLSLGDKSCLDVPSVW